MYICVYTRRDRKSGSEKQAEGEDWFFLPTTKQQVATGNNLSDHGCVDVGHLDESTLEVAALVEARVVDAVDMAVEWAHHRVRHDCAAAVVD